MSDGGSGAYAPHGRAATAGTGTLEVIRLDGLDLTAAERQEFEADPHGHVGIVHLTGPPELASGYMHHDV